MDICPTVEAWYQSRHLQGFCKCQLPTESSRINRCHLKVQDRKNGSYSKEESNPGIWEIRKGFLEEVALELGMQGWGEMCFLSQEVGDLAGPSEPWIQSLGWREGQDRGRAPAVGGGVRWRSTYPCKRLKTARIRTGGSFLWSLHAPES